MHRTMGRAHAALHHAGRWARAELGQGTVEYVALILLVRNVKSGRPGTCSGGEGRQPGRSRPVRACFASDAVARA
jgi:hypothetical protein